MKKLRTIHIALVLIILSAAVIGAAVYWDRSFSMFLGFSGPDAATFTISIDSNTQWSGTVNGFPRSGIGSANFTVHGTTASVCLQMQTDSGYLTATILKDGQTMNSQTTSEPHGTITISC